MDDSRGYQGEGGILMKEKLYVFFKYASEFGLYGLLFFLPISNSLIEVFFCITFFSFTAKKIIKPDFARLKSLPNLFLLVFFIFIGFSLVNSGQYFHKSLWALAGKWAQYIGVCLIAQDISAERKVLKRAVSVFLFSACLVILSGLSQRFLGAEFLRGRPLICVSDKFCAITSAFKYYNALGTYLITAIPLFFGAFVIGVNKKWKFSPILALFLVFAVFADALTYSRGSWVGFIFSMMFLLIMIKDSRSRLIIIFTVVIFAAFFIIPAFFAYAGQSMPLNSFIGRAISSFQAEGDADRFKYWQVAIRMIHENPFLGKGVGTFMDYFSRYLPTLNISYAHNCYLQIWAETGIFSLFSFLIFVGLLFWFGIKSFLAKKDYLLIGLLTGISAYLTHAFFDTALYSLPLAFLFWILAGLTLSLTKSDN